MERRNYSCKPCEKGFIGLSFFYSHLRSVHHSQVYCPLAVCLCQYSNIRSLQAHLAKDHKFDKPVLLLNEKLSMKCPIKSCAKDITSRQHYLDHMPGHFADGEVLHCSYPVKSKTGTVDCCGAYIGTVRSFRSHVSSVHKLKYKDITSDRDTSDNPPTDVSEDSSNEETNIIKPQVTHSEKINPPQIQENVQKEKEEEVNFPEYMVKDELAKFYLRLEGEHFLPTATVQKIAEEIKLLTELSHHHLKKNLKLQLQEHGLDDKIVTEIVGNTFNADPVYNTHHKKKDYEQFGTNHLREKFWKKNYPYIEPKECYLGKDEFGRKKRAHYVSIKDSIKMSLKDPMVKKQILESFTQTPEEGSPTVLSDFTDGTAFINHKKQHNGGKCIYINLFQDGCDNRAFGPTIGRYKPNNFYFAIGNLCPEHRTKLSTIHLVYCILEKHLKNTEIEELKDIDKLKEALKPLIDELEDLKENGIVIDGEVIPVCLLFLLGDNLGQHLIGGFVGSFSSQQCCRFCEITMTEFRADPTTTKPFRTPAEYDQSVDSAKRSWTLFRQKCLKNVSRQKLRLLNRVRAPGSKQKVKRILAKSTYAKLKGIHHKGVKYRPSPFNSNALKFHCASPSLPVCISHDLWEGIAKNMVPKILSSFIEKGWFDLITLNRRIESFHFKGSDKADAATGLKSLNSLGGNASENWTLVRFLPLIIGDLIEDKNDKMWQLYLKFKAIAEYVCAPRITTQQVAFLKSLIAEYLLEVKRLLPQCLYPKQHFLYHVPELIMIFGPLQRLFTMRFESFHVFFKNAATAANNYKNITKTLSRKYMCKFALDHSTNLLEKDVVYNYYNSSPIIESDFQEQAKEAIPDTVFTGTFRIVSSVKVKGTNYQNDSYMVLDSLDLCDLKVGRIETIFLDTSCDEVYFLLNIKPAINTFQGYYHVTAPAVCYHFLSLKSIPDYYPLPIYNVGGVQCLTLKHTMISM